MGALPKRKYAKARQGERRGHLKLSPPSLTSCPQCHSPRLSHHVCPVCGTYDGREVIEIKTAGKKPG
ncbi:MAG: 50S ribosomal protein L32 [Dehalococcoidales bacterium]|nr:50S ribosomal protein L32 [Dehalococcoidales bacterium]